MVKIGIVGGGVIGLGSAISIQEKCPGVDLTLISEKFSPDTTGDGAAGIWGPYLLSSTSPLLIVEWAQKTHELFLKFWKSKDSGDLGISLVPAFFVSDNESYSEPQWKDVVFGFRQMSAEELLNIRPGLKRGFAFTTFICEPSKLLPHLLNKFCDAGGKVLTRRVTDLESLRNEFDIIVNCTGLEAYNVVPDRTMFPIRGQIMRVEYPGLFYTLLDDSDDGGGYAIPNQTSVVLGGTHQEGDWNTNVDPKDTEMIKNYCHSIVPSFKEASLLKNWVGLRPGRPQVRLEKEVLPPLFSGGKPFTIIHNYGHAGSGITLFWGCAQHATSLVQQAILGFASKL